MTSQLVSENPFYEFVDGCISRNVLFNIVISNVKVQMKGYFQHLKFKYNSFEGFIDSYFL